MVVHPQLRETAGHVAGMAPMDGDFVSVEQTSRREAVDASANGADARDGPNASQYPIGDAVGDAGCVDAAAARDDDGIEVGRVLQIGQAGEGDAGFGLEAIRADRDEMHLVTGNAPAVAVIESGGGESLGGADEMERVDAIKADQADVFWFHEAWTGGWS